MGLGFSVFRFNGFQGLVGLGFSVFRFNGFTAFRM